MRFQTPGVVGTAVALAYAHQQIIPFEGSNWIASSATSQNFPFEIDRELNAGAWSVIGFNTTANPVTWNVYFTIELPNPVERELAPRPTVIEPGELYLAAGQLDLDRAAADATISSE